MVGGAARGPEPVPLLGNPTTAAVAALGRGTQTERAAAFLAAAERIATTETVLRLTRTMLILRFGDAPGVEAIAEGLAGLSDEERLTRIAAAAGLTDLER